MDWEKEWKTGDARHGRQLFDSLGCSKCHAVSNESPSGGGPSLADAGKRFTSSLRRGIRFCSPAKSSHPLFRLTAIRLKSREVISGLVVSETADKLDLRLSDTTLRTLDKSQIDARKEQEGSPMPQGLVRTPEELKDLMAFVMRGHVATP